MAKTPAKVETGNRLADYGPALDAAINRVGMPKRIADELRAEWAAFVKEHTDDDPEEVRFEYELHPSRLGLIVIVLEPEKKDLKITVKAVDSDYGTEEILYPLPAVTWEPVLPVGERKAERRVGPNAACACGSGKKTKKCCGK